jgi:FkbM family methyltransferase
MQQTARTVASLLGRNSALIRAIRPAYESLLHSLHDGKGIPWTVNGVEFRIDPRERPRFGEHYEAETAAFLQSRIRSGMTCFDIGANVGAYVLQLGNWSKPDGRIIAFEPNTGARDVLATHIEWNGLDSRVTVVPMAVGSSVGESVMYAAGADGMSRLSEANRGLKDSAIESKVAVTTIDTYCRAHNVWPDLILLDIEGFEIEALRGAREAIARSRPVIVIEMHPNVWSSSAASRPQVELLFAELGVKAMGLSNQRDPLDDHGQVYLEYL